jgi:hypothetical protein
MKFKRDSHGKSTLKRSCRQSGFLKQVRPAILPTQGAGSLAKAPAALSFICGLHNGSS